MSKLRTEGKNKSEKEKASRIKAKNKSISIKEKSRGYCHLERKKIVSREIKIIILTPR